MIALTARASTTSARKDLMPTSLTSLQVVLYSVSGGALSFTNPLSAPIECALQTWANPGRFYAQRTRCCH